MFITNTYPDEITDRRFKGRSGPCDVLLVKQIKSHPNVKIQLIDSGLVGRMVRSHED